MSDFVMLIPIAGIAVGGLAVWTDHKYKMAKAMFKAEPTLDKATQERIAKLEDRVRVLERIAVEPASDLARQIEALTDQRTEPLAPGSFASTANQLDSQMDGQLNGVPRT